MGNWEKGVVQKIVEPGHIPKYKHKFLDWNPKYDVHYKSFSNYYDSFKKLDFKKYAPIGTYCYINGIPKIDDYLLVWDIDTRRWRRCYVLEIYKETFLIKYQGFTAKFNEVISESRVFTYNFNKKKTCCYTKYYRDLIST